MQSLNLLQLPQIFVVCKASWDNGIEYGRWIKASQPIDAILYEIDAILQLSPSFPAKDWHIEEIRGFEGLLSPSPTLQEISNVGMGIEQYGRAFVAFAQNSCEQPTIELFEEKLEGYGTKEITFTRYRFQTNYKGNFDHVEPYIDWQKMAENWFTNDYYSVKSLGGIFVFSRH